MIFCCINCGKTKTGYHSAANKYCSKACKTEYTYNENIRLWKSGIYSGNKGIKFRQVANYVKKYIELKFNYTCVSCGTGTKWNGKSLSLQIEHLDGNSDNTTEDNLSLLCPNCHTQTDFYGSKNKGRGRGSLSKVRVV
jgi:hypothetical protein